jgi:hypothetical protein
LPPQALQQLDGADGARIDHLDRRAARMPAGLDGVIGLAGVVQTASEVLANYGTRALASTL